MLCVHYLDKCAHKFKIKNEKTQIYLLPARVLINSAFSHKSSKMIIQPSRVYTTKLLKFSGAVCTAYELSAYSLKTHFASLFFVLFF